MRDYRDRRLDEVTPGTARRDLELLRAMINHARKEWGLDIANPVEAVKLRTKAPARDRRLDLDEEMYLLNELTPVTFDKATAAKAKQSEIALAKAEGRKPRPLYFQGTRNKWILPAVMFALETAMRRSEIIATLEWENVDLSEKIALLSETKNGFKRVVPMSARAIDILSHVVPATEHKRRVFPISISSLVGATNRVKKRAIEAYRNDCLKAGRNPSTNFLADFRFHDIRHEATSWLATKLPNSS